MYVKVKKHATILFSQSIKKGNMLQCLQSIKSTKIINLLIWIFLSHQWYIPMVAETQP